VKFLCDQCKAKYQIADEKVAGRTVRMKCRKCGHMIEVRAEVTESSVSRFPPAAPEGEREQKGSPLATSLSAARPAPRPAAQAPGALAGAFQKKVKSDDDDATIMAPASIAFEASVTDEWYAAINGVPVGPVRLSELRTKVAAGQVTEDTLVWQDGFEEWRPVKTITQLAAIVREAAGQKPLTGTSPPSPTPAPPRAGVAPAGVKPSPAARQTAPIGPAPAAAAVRNNVVPISRGAPSSGSAAVALAAPAPAAPASSPALAPAAAPAAAALSNPFAGIDPFAAPAPAAAPAAQVASDPFAFGAPAPSADPFALPPPQNEAVAAPLFAPAPAPAMAAPAVTELPPQPPQEQQKKGAPLFFIAAVVLAAAFGITAAVLTFKKDPAQPLPVASATPSAAPVVPTASAATTAAPTETVAQVEPDAGAASTPQKVAMGGPKPATGGAPAAPSATTKTAADLGSLGLTTGSGGATGPSGGPAGPSAGSGQALDAASIQKTIGTYKAAVKRKCWDNAAENKPSANVQVSVTVAGNGSVTSASASGDDPAVAKCVENHVRGWHFDGGGQTVIPFHFVRQ
jgi:predicted Zn finger-like uncharacterized protein